MHRYELQSLYLRTSVSGGICFEKVDHLYLFVVEEDKSFFPFRDRLELVKKGVEKFANVEVLPSGRLLSQPIRFRDIF